MQAHGEVQGQDAPLAPLADEGPELEEEHGDAGGSDGDDGAYPEEAAQRLEVALAWDGDTQEGEEAGAQYVRRSHGCGCGSPEYWPLR